MTTDKYCDCAQGRWPCTCMPRSPRMSREALRHLRAGGRVRYADGKEQLLEALPTGPSIAQLIKQGYLSRTGHFKDRRAGTEFLSELDRVEKTRPGYWERLATDKAKLFALKCAEFDVLNARLRVYQGVAVIGWAGFILTLLGV